MNPVGVSALFASIRAMGRHEVIAVRLHRQYLKGSIQYLLRWVLFSDPHPVCRA